MRVLDLFCGAGGASYGFKTEGFEIIGGLDVDSVAASSYEINVGAPVLVADAFKTDPKTLMNFFGKADVIIGCPPCQGFSRLRKKPANDPRNALVLRYLKYVEVLRPKVAVFENVVGFRRWEGGRYALLLLKKLSDVGYETTEGILDSVDFGVPQFRRRYVIIASADGKPVLPRPTHGARAGGSGASGKIAPWRTVRDAIGRLRPLNPGESDPEDPLHSAPRHGETTLRLIRAVPKDGGSRTDVPKELWLRCHLLLECGFGDVYGRMRWDEPAPTITCGCLTPSKGRFLHPEQDRGITLREAALLQGFSSDYEFCGTKAQIASQIGNALPPPFAAALARAVRKIL